MEKIRRFWNDFPPLGRAQYFGCGVLGATIAWFIGWLSGHNMWVMLAFSFCVLPVAILFVKGRARDIEMGTGRPTWAFPAMCILFALLAPLNVYAAFHPNYITDPQAKAVTLYFGMPLSLCFLVVGTFLYFKKGKKAIDAAAENERLHREDEARLSQHLKGQS